MSLKTNQTAQAVANAMLQQKDFCKLYSITSANMNENVEERSNRVTVIAENADLSRELIKSAKLQDDFFNAVSRITVWLDSNAVVVYVGAVFAVHAKLAEQTAEQKEQFSQLFNQSIDKKYNERLLKKVKITALTETRHCFKSVEEFTTFFSLLAQLVTARKTALAQTDSKQKEQKQNSKQKQSQQKQKDSKQKQNSKQKQSVDFSKVSAEALAQMTEEIISEEQKKA